MGAIQQQKYTLFLKILQLLNTILEYSIVKLSISRNTQPGGQVHSIISDDNKIATAVNIFLQCHKLSGLFIFCKQLTEETYKKAVSTL